jgi:P-type Cu+ transporter
MCCCSARIIWQNFGGTIVVDVAGIALAVAGLVSPALAAFIHVASEMAFILNSARLLPGFGRRAPAIKAEEELLTSAA